MSDDSKKDDPKNVIDMRRKVEARIQEEKKQLSDSGGGDGGEKGSRFGDAGDGDGGKIDSRFILDCLNANELGDGSLFKTLHQGKFVFCKSMDAWLVWNGHHWEIDILDQALAAVERVVDTYLDEVDRINEQLRGMYGNPDQKDVISRLEATRTNLFKRVSRLRSSKGRKNCLHFAHTCDEPMAIRGDELDRNPYLLACKNGVIDLKTGLRRDGRPEDYLLKASPIEWTGIDEACPSWEKFLTEIFSENEQLVKFVDRVLGYALVGISPEHIIVVLSGRGRNGKGTIVDILSFILGRLAGPIRAEMLLDQSRYASSAGPTPDIMALRGLRMAFASETDENAKISPSRVKWLTGNDELTGRNPHDKYETTFRPTHTLFLLTNHKPHAPADDFAFWERVRLVPFELSYVDRDIRSENERVADKDLPEKLKLEASGILAWLVRGCLLWQKEGLDPPPVVKKATEEYRRDEDIMADFMDECCILDETVEVGASNLYTVFEAWWKINVHKNPPKQKWFGKIAGRRFERAKVSGTYRYYGIRLLDHIQEYVDTSERIDERELTDLLKFGVQSGA